MRPGFSAASRSQLPAVQHTTTSPTSVMTANGAWIYNHVGANLSGILVILLGAGVWRMMSPDLLGRVGAATRLAAGTSTFFDGIFRLDCRGIDPRCDNVSRHSHAHKIESRFTAALTLLSPLILTVASRRKATCRTRGFQPSRSPEGRRDPRIACTWPINRPVAHQKVGGRNADAVAPASRGGRPPA
jgi:Protein of unknown function (DUF998)